jgi:Ran GTPase-activating protein (RanGAP) involved in mRNA processing and transport
LHLTADFGRRPRRSFEWEREHRVPPSGFRIKWFLSSPHLENLRDLSLADSSFNNEGIREVLSCGNLRLHSLDLSGNDIVPSAIRLGLDTFQLLGAASCAKELRDLALRSNDLSIDHILILTYSRNLANLESLDLTGNKLGSQANMISLVGLERFPMLEHLKLSACCIGDAGTRALAQSSLWQQLESLTLWNNEISDQGLFAVAFADPPGKLRSLELRRNAIGNAGLSALARSAVLRAISELHLEYNRIDDEGAAALAASDHAENLRELHLRGNRALGERGGLALAAAGFPALEVLDLAGTQVGDASAREIAASPKSANLHVLDLGGTRLTDAGAKALTDSQFLGFLEFVDLLMNGLTAACVTALKERFGHRVLV